MNLSRTIIVGNSGSGKSWLAERIVNHLGTPCIDLHLDLDLVYWLPGGYSVTRERNEAIRLIREAGVADRWVIEGIYGFLIDEILTRATALVWLCCEESECVANIRKRGIRRGGTEQSFASLLDWAASYRSRHGSSSYTGHATVFEKYTGEKTVLRSRSAITAFAEGLT
jgi:adenylate kinase family enzyme